jgi:hypothetical protein
MPTLMPALAITRSGSPCREMQSAPAAAMLAGTATSAPYATQRSSPKPWAAAQAATSSVRRATSASRQPAWAWRIAKAWPMPLEAPVMKTSGAVTGAPSRLA